MNQVEGGCLWFDLTWPSFLLQSSYCSIGYQHYQQQNDNISDLLSVRIRVIREASFVFLIHPPPKYPLPWILQDAFLGGKRINDGILAL